MHEYFYQVGGSLAKNAPTYVERLADRQLYQALIQGEFCYVFNSRQMGKSSLLVHTRKRLEKAGYACTTIDLTKIGSENITPLQWYKGIVTDLWQGFNLIGKLRLKSWWQETENISLLQKLNQFIESVILANITAEKIFIFVDEIDSILGLDFPVDDFFALIRFCYNQRATNPAYHRLSFALFGVATPSDLIQDKSRTPFNIGTAIDLGGFTLEQAQPLLKGLSDHVSHPENVLKEILAWTNGQPFLTQKLCNLVTMAANSMGEGLTIPPGTEAFWVDSLVKSQVIKHWESQDEPEHLRTIRDRLLRNQQKAGRLLGIYQQILEADIPEENSPKPPLKTPSAKIEESASNLSPFLREGKGAIASDDSREQIELILSGLVVKYQGYLKVKNCLYQEVFNLAWVAKQLSALRPYSQTFDAWVASGQTDESRLLRGRALKDAQLWAQGKSLSDLDYQFLAQSAELEQKEIQVALEAARIKEVEARLVEEQGRLEAESQKLHQEQKAARLQRLILVVVSVALAISSGIGGFAFWQYRQARISEIIALASSSKGLFASDNRLNAIIDAIKAQRRMDSFRKMDRRIIQQVNKTLIQALYRTNELNRLIGHQGTVFSVDISSDGQLIATASQDKTVKIWQSNGKLLQDLKHSGTVFRLAFSSDGKYLVSGSLDGSVKIWTVDGKLVKKIQHGPASVWGVAFSPNGEMVASSSSDRTVKIWRTDGTLLTTLAGHEKAVWNVAFSRDSQIIASAGVDNLVKIWTVDGKLLNTLVGHEGSVWDVAFCQETNLLVSGSGDKTAKLWRTDGTLVKTFPAGDVLLGVDCSDNGEYIATSGNDSGVKIWRTDGTLVSTLRKHDGVVRDVALSRDGLMTASASDDSTVKLWRFEQNLLKLLYGHEDTVWEVATSPDGKLIASVGGNSLLLWQSDGKLLQKITTPSPGIRSLAWSANGQTIAIGTNGFTIEVFDLVDNLADMNQPQLKLRKVLTGHQASVYGIAISPDGQTIASGGDDRTIKLWNIDGKLKKSFAAHNERIWKLAFTPDGETIASASEDATVKLWKKDGTPIVTLPHENPVSGVAIAPQGNLIASASRDDTLRLWKLDGTLVKTIPAESKGLTRVVFSPDGQTIATGGSDNTVKLWNLEGKLLDTLPGHESMVISLAVTADGKFVVSGGDDRTVILWDLDKIRNLKKLEYACDWVRDYLRTNAELEEKDRDLCKGVKSGEKND
jgi:WD40 repeat protein